MTEHVSLDQFASINAKGGNGGGGGPGGKGGGGGKPQPPEEPAGESYSAVYVLGDSLVDSGNILDLANFYGSLPLTDNPEGAPYASDGYFDGRFSNGYTYADLVANKYVGDPTDEVFPFGYEVDTIFGYVPLDPFAGDPSGDSLNFAYGGAQIIRGNEAGSHLDHQTDALRDAVDHEFASDALVLVTIGGNDVRELAPASSDPAYPWTAYSDLQASADKLLHEMLQLADEGAQTIVITGIPDVGIIPRYDIDFSLALEADEQARADAASEYSAYLDTLIRTEVVPALETAGVRVVYVPLSNVTDGTGAVIEDGALDLVLPTLEALYGLAPGELTTNLLAHQDIVFFDEVHPTAQVHALVGSYIYSEINGTPWIETMPLTAAEIAFSAAGTIATSGEADTFTIVLERGETYTIEVLGMATLGLDGSLADPELSIADPRGRAVTDFTDDSGGDSGLGFDAMFTFTASRSGEYTITVEAAGSITGDYVLQIGTPLAALTASTLEATYALSSQRQADQSVALAAAGFLALPAQHLIGSVPASPATIEQEGQAISFVSSPSIARAASLLSAADEGGEGPGVQAVIQAAPDRGSLVDDGEGAGTQALASLPNEAVALAGTDAANAAVTTSEPGPQVDVGDVAAMQALLMLGVGEGAGESVADFGADRAELAEALGDVLGQGAIDAVIAALSDTVDAPEVILDEGGAIDLAAILDAMVTPMGVAPAFVLDLTPVGEGEAALA